MWHERDARATFFESNSLVLNHSRCATPSRQEHRPKPRNVHKSVRKRAFMMYSSPHHIHLLSVPLQVLYHLQIKIVKLLSITL